MPAKSGQVFDQQYVYLSVLHRELYLMKSLSLKRHTRYIVVEALACNFVAVQICVVHKYLTLILKTVHLSILVSGQSVI